jgi:SPP1 gp7 family putative phage head morphogenesis protein
MPDSPLSLIFGLPFVDAIAAARARGVRLPEQYYGEVQGAIRRTATTVSGLASLDQIIEVIDSVTQSMARGESFAEWQRIAMLRGWGLPPGRLETIFRTNVQTAYSDGHWRAFEENKARRPFLMWSAINDSRVRPTHLAMDGYIAPVDDAIWREWHPPAGYNCRCSQISITEAQAIARGYGKQTQPNVHPDKGFAGHGGIGTVMAEKIAKAPPAVRQAVVQRTVPIAPKAYGPPVSGALTLPTTGGKASRSLRDVLRAIDSVHGDGTLPNIPVEFGLRGNALGQYRYSPISDKAGSIKVKTRAPRPMMTLAHEIGHFLDNKGWGGRGFSSANEAAAEAWRVAVRASPEAQQIKAARFDMSLDSGARKWASYASQTHELWARSYAQWVALRSGNADMAAELTYIKTAAPSPVYRLSQWGAAEFEPIAKAIDDLFSSLGWRY